MIAGSGREKILTVGQRRFGHRIWCKTFHQYLVGRHFCILSDHKPLQHLFRETSGIPVLASARIQRWALILGAYDYTIHKPGSQHNNAVLLSRLPLSDTRKEVPIPGETVLAMEMLFDTMPVTGA